MKSYDWEILYKGREISKKEDLIEVLLKNRGIDDKESFLCPVDPLDLKLADFGFKKEDFEAAFETIRGTSGDIIVYGDYDADGVCSTAILASALRDSGMSTFSYIPDRFSEGYGINPTSVSKLKELYPKASLIITVDNGISAVEGVGAARELGFDVIVTDHHEKPKELPAANAIIHTTKISGSGVSWVVARELRKKFNSFNLRDGLDLAAIGTVADILPLVHANRSIVKFGIDEIHKTKRVGIVALADSSSLNLNDIGAYEISFVIAPRLNASGRIAHAQTSLELLVTENINEARELAYKLSGVNSERQKVVGEVTIDARSRVDSDSKGVIMIGSEQYHEGVIGLVASRMVEEFYRPSFVYVRGAEFSKVSVRSVAGFDVISAIRELDGFIEQGGGHAMAAGFTIRTEKIEEFTSQINKLYLEKVGETPFRKRLLVDSEISFSMIDWELVSLLLDFEPTGPGNPTPLFLTSGVSVANAFLVGRDRTHLKLKVSLEGAAFDAIAFGFGGLFKDLSPDSKIDLVYQIEENVWNGTRDIQLKVKGIDLK